MQYIHPRGWIGVPPALALFVLAPYLCAAEPGPPIDPRIRVAAEGYMANLESFKSFTCRYTVSSAVANTVEEARAGKLISETVCPPRLWLVDGQNQLHLQRADAQSEKRLQTSKPEAVPGKPGMSVGPSVTFATRNEMSDGHVFARHNPWGNVINICPPDATPAIDDTPFDGVGFGKNSRNISSSIQSTLSGLFVCEACETKVVEDRSVIWVRFHAPQHRSRVEIALDPDRGYLPLQYYFYHDDKTKGSLLYVLKSARACSKGRWFPEHVMVISAFPNEKPDIKEIKVLELDADHRPKKEAFAFPVPAGARVINCKEQQKWFQLKQDEVIDLDSLPRLLEMTYKAKEVPQFDTAIPRRRSYAWLWWVGGTVGLICAGGLGYRWRRRRLA